jgi:hypothetical protein
MSNESRAAANSLDRTNSAATRELVIALVLAKES